MFCSKCGRMANPADTFCGGCGLILPFVKTNSRSTPRGRGSLIIGISVAVLGVIVFGTVLLNLSRSSYGVAPVITPTAVSRQAGASPNGAPVKTVQLEAPAVATEHGTSAKAKSQIPATTPEAAVSVSRPAARLTELRGSLARRREYDLRIIKSAFYVLNADSEATEICSHAQHVSCQSLARHLKTGYYCAALVDGMNFNPTYPEHEYALQADDGTVLKTSGKPPMTPEQILREAERRQWVIESGAPEHNAIVQDCRHYLPTGSWHDQPMLGDEKLKENSAKAQADLDEIDKTLDPRLVEGLPKEACIASAAAGMEVFAFIHGEWDRGSGRCKFPFPF
jgi:hypothetical protein